MEISPKQKKSPLIDKIDRLTATSFQKKVWKAILGIPRGEVRSYSWVADRMGHPKAVRAVGNALNKNPLAPAVPCHRVIKKDGSIGGFAQGTKKKIALLKKENAYNV